MIDFAIYQALVIVVLALKGKALALGGIAGLVNITALFFKHTHGYFDGYF